MKPYLNWLKRERKFPPSFTSPDPVYIYHHMGLGDHIICNSLVRQIVSSTDNKVFLFVKEHNYENVSMMYRDLKDKLQYITGDDNDVKNFLETNSIKNIIKIGFDRMNPFIRFDRAFYWQFHLPIKKRFEGFYYERDYDRENYTCQALNTTSEEYVFYT